MRLADKMSLRRIEKSRVAIIQRDRHMPANIFIRDHLSLKPRNKTFARNAFLPVTKLDRFLRPKFRERSNPTHVQKYALLRAFTSRYIPRDPGANRSRPSLAPLSVPVYK